MATRTPRDIAASVEVAATDRNSINADPPVVVTINPELVLLAAYASDSNTITVYLNNEPKALSPLADNDVLNRLNWTLSVVSGLGVEVPVITKVENVRFDDAIVLREGVTGEWAVDLRVDKRLLLSGEYRVVVANVGTASGGALSTGTGDDRADFPGVAVARPRRPRRPNRARTGIDLFYDTFAARYSLTPRRDIAAHDGVDYLRKRLIRRVVSSPGGFAHLPTYGVGLEPKKLFRTTEAAELRTAVLNQVLQEPEVAQASVDVQLLPDTVLLFVKARTKAGSSFGLSLEADSEGTVTVL